MFEFELPDVGEGVAEGEIVAWHVEPGDEVEEDELLAEVETDKAVVDLPSPVTGTVAELHAEEGEVVAVGSVVVTIEVEGEEPDESEADVEPADAGEEAAGAETDAEAAESESAGGRVFAPPNVRRLARELDVDITSVDGSGPSGRVTEGDVRAAAESGGADDETEPAVTKADSGAGDGASAGTETARESATRSVGSNGDTGATAAVESADRDRTLAVPATRKLARDLDVDIDAVPTDRTRDGEPFVGPEEVQAFAEAQEAAEAGEATTAGTGGAEAVTAGRDAQTDQQAETREPYRGIRRTIGKQMEQSAFTAPHATHHDKAVVDELVEVREQLKPKAEEQGVKLTYLPFVMKAIVAGLKEYPDINSELDEENEEIVYKNYYNLGMAVATDAGLMVPVVDNVDDKSILELAAETNELAGRARDRSIAPDEMQGGTFTITNFGAIGGEYATPIINYPEAGILGLGALEQRPVVEDGEVVARHTLPLSLAIDHRIIDGAEGAGFVNTVIEHLENPSLLLL